MRDRATQECTRWLVLAVPVSLGCGLKVVEDKKAGAEIPQEVQRAFDGTCAIPSCHSATDREAGLSLAEGDSISIVGGNAQGSDLPMVELGNLEGSYMALKMLPADQLPDDAVVTGARMPADGDFDNPNNAIILGWIAFSPPTEEATGSGTGGGTDTGTDVPEPYELCGILDLAPGVESPVDFGASAGQLPFEVGMVIRDNCGCHQLTEDQQELYLSAVDRPGAVFFNTWDEVHAEYTMTETMADRMQDRAVNENQSGGPFPMPPEASCSELEIGTLLMDDWEILRQWLDNGAPDALGNQWMP